MSTAIASALNTAAQTTPVETVPRVSLEQLIDRHGARLAPFLKRLGVARADVDDVQQCTWLTVSRCLDRIHPGSELGFLLAVARREAGHVRRTHRRRCEVAQPEFDEFVASAPAIDDWVCRRQEWELARAAMQEMDDSLRAVLLLVEVDDASMKDAAALLDIPVGTVKSRLRRARVDCSSRTAARSLLQRAPARASAAPRSRL
jgi:RNA polymerase sigma-70 factor (ECF subfamily)